MLSDFEGWAREPTPTERLASLLRSQGLEIEVPKEWRDIYRIQRKVTGVEGRRALCYLNTGKGCSDIDVTWDGFPYHGIDLLAPVKDLVRKGVTILPQRGADHFLWVTTADPSSNKRIRS